MAMSAHSLGKPKGTLRQPRSLSVPEEGGKRPVPRPPRGREVACGVVRPAMESARSALPPAAGSGPPKEMPMQRHVTVVNRSVCVRVCACEQGEMKGGGPLDAAVPGRTVRSGTWESGLPPLPKVKVGQYPGGSRVTLCLLGCCRSYPMLSAAATSCGERSAKGAWGCRRFPGPGGSCCGQRDREQREVCGWVRGVVRAMVVCRWPLFTSCLTSPLQCWCLWPFLACWDPTAACSRLGEQG